MKVSRTPARIPGAESGRVTLQERGARRGVQVLRGLDQPSVEPLEIGVDRQDHEREEVVGEPGDHRPGRVEDPAGVAEQADAAQGLDQRALVGEDRLPGERPDQVGGEEGGDDGEQDQALPAPGAEGDRVCERVGDRESQHRGDGAVCERAHELLAVGRERIAEVPERPVEDEAVLERAALERDDAHEEHRHDEEEAEPQRPRRQQGEGRTTAAQGPHRARRAPPRAAPAYVAIPW